MQVNTTQQKETLDYFNGYAKDWERKANISSQTEVNIIKQRKELNHPFLPPLI